LRRAPHPPSISPYPRQNLFPTIVHVFPSNEKRNKEKRITPCPMADPCLVPEMSAKAGIYSKENLKIRHQNRPVVVLVVNFQIFNLFGGAGGLAPPARGSLRRNSETFLVTLLVTKE
ncbi:hypothetical protein MR942_01325, partial [bacterium]|nr:hypothetical protein [bacterium]